MTQNCILIPRDLVRAITKRSSPCTDLAGRIAYLMYSITVSGERTPYYFQRHHMRPGIRGELKCPVIVAPQLSHFLPSNGLIEIYCT